MKIIHATGQMCNQFWIWSNAIADAIENNESVNILYPNFNLDDFENLKNNSIVKIPLLKKEKFGATFLSNLVSKDIGVRILRHLAPLFKCKIEIQNVTTKKSIFKYKHLDIISHIFTPTDSIVSEVENIFSVYKKECDYIIGLHMRRGDYKTFENGKYYYLDSDYLKFMDNILMCFPEKSITFFIASNEKIILHNFEPHSCFKLENSSAVKDMWGLACCDFIIGPPSTYSAWASLYKNVALYFVEDKQRLIEKTSFINIKKKWF